MVFSRREICFRLRDPVYFRFIVLCKDASGVIKNTSGQPGKEKN